MEDRILGGVLVAMIHYPQVAEPFFEFLQPRHFVRPENNIVFGAVIALREARSIVDLITISRYLQEREQLWEIGGRVRLLDLWSLAYHPDDLPEMVATLLQGHQ